MIDQLTLGHQYLWVPQDVVLEVTAHNVLPSVGSAAPLIACHVAQGLEHLLPLGSHGPNVVIPVTELFTDRDEAFKDALVRTRKRLENMRTDIVILQVRLQNLEALEPKEPT